MTAGAALLDLPVPRIAAGEPANLTLVDLDAEWERRRARLREPLGELLLRRPPAARPGPADGRRRRASPTASGRSRVVARSERLRPARGRHALRRRRLRRRRPRHRRGRLHDRDDRLPGVDDRPLLRPPAHHLHLPAHRQLRRRAPRRWSPTASGRARRSCARRRTPRTRPAPSAAGSTGSADCGVPAITGVDTRALVRHIRDAGAMRGGVFPERIAEARGARADRRRAADGRPRPRPRGHARRG